MLTILENEAELNSKISKPDFSTKIGREFLAFYLNSKFKQIIAFDKKREVPFIRSVNTNFIPRFTRRLIDNPERKVMIGITGESASGKSTICSEISRITNQLNIDLETISADNYFNDISELIKIHGSFDALRESGYDVDAPDSFQLDLMKSDLEKLALGENILMPQYLLNGTGTSVPNSLPAISKKIIIVEGLSTMYKDVSEVFDIKIFVDTDKQIQKNWFLRRAKSRNQDLENAHRHWQYVTRASEKYLQPKKSECDIILNGAVSVDYISDIVEFIYRITNNFEEDK